MTCTWEPDPACLNDKWAELTPEVQARSVMLATSTLQMLTLNRVGTCPITVRPCPTDTPCKCWGRYVGSDSHGLPYAPVLWNGDWFNCMGCGSRCSATSEVDLTGPVGYVSEIRVDGAALDLTTGDFRLDEGHILVWQGEGPSPIPKTQNLNLPDSEPGTWSITYSKSYPVGPDARLAVGLLAMEFAEACKPKGKCSLPRGVTNVVRNGVTFTVDAGMFVNGLTGIQIVDAFIMKWVPPGSPGRSATVHVPGVKRERRTSALRIAP